MFKDNLIIEQSDKLINASLFKKTEVNKYISYNVVEIDSKLSKKIGKSKGKYVTIFFDKDNIDKCIEELLNLISNIFKEYFKDINISKNSKILFVGLGNKDSTLDKFGYLMIEKIDINKNIYKIYKNVEGVSNIKSSDFIKSISSLVEADLVIIFDSLKADHVSRLGNTIQLSNSGLIPGSAYSKNGIEVSKKTLRKNVLCVGIPSTLNINLENDDLLVTRIDIDRIVDDMSSLISVSLNRLV